MASFAEARFPPHVLGNIPLVHRDAVGSIAEGLELQGKVPWGKIVAWIVANMPTIIQMLSQGITWQQILAFLLTLLNPPPIPPAAA